jgi:hypothetical protein
MIADTIEDKPRVAIDVEALNNIGVPGNGAGTSPAVSVDDSNPALSARMFKALNALLSQGLTETIREVAARGGVSPRTLYRYMQDPDFMTEYRRLCAQELSVYRAAVTKALIKGATRPGNGQPAMQRLYWERIGEPVVDHSENTNHNHNHNGDIDLDKVPMPLEARRHIVEIIEACMGKGELPPCCLPHARLMPHREPELLPGPARNVTPLEEVELKPAPLRCSNAKLEN